MTNETLDITEFLDDEIAAEYERRGLGDDTLSTVSDFDIEAEYESRGLGEGKFNSYTDEMYDMNIHVLANNILNDMNQDKIVDNRVRQLIETITGKIICV